MELQLGNIFARPIELPLKGDSIPGHRHNFDHATYCVRGTLLVELMNDENGSVDEAVTLEAGSNPLLIVAKRQHRLTALEDDTLGHCIYAHRTPQGEVVQQYTGWSEAYR